MKKVKNIVLLIVGLVLFANPVSAAPTASSNTDLQTCLAFADTFTGITAQQGSYYYKSCFKVSCSSSKTYIKGSMVQNVGYRCLNGNERPYVKVTSDGCSSYTGTCNNFSQVYCEEVKLIDCNKKSDGTPFTTTGNTTASRTVNTTSATTRATTVATTKTTTRKKTTNTKTVAPFTNPPKTTVPATTVPTTTETTTTEPPIPNNANIKTIKINGKSIKYTNGTDTYSVKVKYGKNDIDVDVELEEKNPNTVVEITGNKDMPDEDAEIKIKVTAQGGATKEVTIKIKRYTAENNDCTLANIHMEETPIEFSKSNYEYKLKLPKGVNQLDMEIVPNDQDNATYEIKGNENLKNNSVVSVEVTAQDGTLCTYKITIKKTTNTWKYVILIILLTGALVVASRFLYKFLKKSKGQYKYE